MHVRTYISSNSYNYDCTSHCSQVVQISSILVHVMVEQPLLQNSLSQTHYYHQFPLIALTSPPLSPSPHHTHPLTHHPSPVGRCSSPPLPQSPPPCHCSIPRRITSPSPPPLLFPLFPHSSSSLPHIPSQCISSSMPPPPPPNYAASSSLLSLAAITTPHPASPPPQHGISSPPPSLLLCATAIRSLLFLTAASPSLLSYDTRPNLDVAQ